MRAATMVQQPPTPPNGSAELQYGLHHLIQHNAGWNLQYDGQEAQYLSRPGSHYDSPAPIFTPVYRKRRKGKRLMAQKDNYGAQPGYYQHDGQYNGIQYSQHGMLSGSPPTPRSTTDYSDAGRHTRSGRSIARSGSPRVSKSRPKPSPKPKKAKAPKADKPKTPKLTAPLSILTKDYDHIPVRNMEEWVNRPPEVRRKEVEKRNGYVTRPMNSFMLYRSAYAERTKQWCLQNNHQVVSSVSGESWPMEPPEVRELYNDYAKIERINHQNAHPTYKFSPSKAATTARKRKGEYSDDDDEPSDLDDPDADWGPPGHRRSRPKPRRPGKEAGYPSNSDLTSGLNNNRYFGPNGGLNRSSWEANNEGKPLPVPMGQGDLYGQYYQTTIHQNMTVPGMEDVHMRKMGTPGSSMQFSQDPSLIGLPGGQTSDWLQQLHSHAGTPLNEPQVDPMLLAYDDRGLGGQTGHLVDGGTLLDHNSDFKFSNGHYGMIERELDQDSVHSLLAGDSGQGEYHPEAWQVDPTVLQMEQGSEFDKWMDDHHAS
ncbi:uncharacterized protein BDZ99DRAFT_451245 [Mytilinidion resinicola]|uniref:HMG box domain-containing protein n=1 Tax=Mytilinidion resinicola TaxID=574789 RepID=A0A6A6Y9Y6_9PEZI|nr:uncharacterized protein BDZ99DRAFT_451245 [Mytilinidion resinicola]KAF2804804.1 hypothetical protein BDZ99DRAFT_451245 [Mytilinidion resinicola]